MSDENVEHMKQEEQNSNEVYKISKLTIWKMISAILAIALVFTFFTNDGNSTGNQVRVVPTQNQPIQNQPTPTQQQPQEPSRQEISLDDDAVLGDPNAPVTIVSFEDYQCPFCGRAFQQTFPLIKKDYIDKGLVKFVYRDFPLSFHPEAQPAAEAAECAGEQGKYWEYHDGIYNNQQLLSSEFYPKLASELGLDIVKFNECFNSGKYKQEVQDDFAYGSQVGVSGTPTFFINGVKLVGAQPFSAFKQVIDAELAAKQS